MNANYAIVNAIKLCDIMQALEMIKGLLFIVTMFMHIFYRSTALPVCVCVSLTDLPPFPPLPSSNQTDRELKVRI